MKRLIIPLLACFCAAPSLHGALVGVEYWYHPTSGKSVVLVSLFHDAVMSFKGNRFYDKTRLDAWNKGLVLTVKKMLDTKKGLPVFIENSTMQSVDGTILKTGEITDQTVKSLSTLQENDAPIFNWDKRSEEFQLLNNLSMLGPTGVMRILTQVMGVDTPCEKIRTALDLAVLRAAVWKEKYAQDSTDKLLQNEYEKLADAKKGLDRLFDRFDKNTPFVKVLAQLAQDKRGENAPVYEKWTRDGDTGFANFNALDSVLGSLKTTSGACLVAGVFHTEFVASVLQRMGFKKVGALSERNYTTLLGGKWVFPDKKLGNPDVLVKIFEQLGDEKKPCSNCLTPHAKSVCSRCAIACYCSRECQSTHWKAGHKLECQKIHNQATKK